MSISRNHHVFFPVVSIFMSILKKGNINNMLHVMIHVKSVFISLVMIILMSHYLRRILGRLVEFKGQGPHVCSTCQHLTVSVPQIFIHLRNTLDHDIVMRWHLAQKWRNGSFFYLDKKFITAYRSYTMTNSLEN